MEDVAARLGLKDRQIRITNALTGDDALGVVIRAHIYIEFELIEFIRGRAVPADAIDAIGLNYGRRATLALHLGLPPKFKAPLDFIGRLRNRFAHNPDAGLESKDADEFERAMGPDGRAFVEQAYRRMVTAQKANLVESREPKDRIVLQFLNLWAGIAVRTAKEKAAKAVLAGLVRRS